MDKKSPQSRLTVDFTAKTVKWVHADGRVIVDLQPTTDTIVFHFPDILRLESVTR